MHILYLKTAGTIMVHQIIIISLILRISVKHPLLKKLEIFFIRLIKTIIKK